MRLSNHFAAIYFLNCARRLPTQRPSIDCRCGARSEARRHATTVNATFPRHVKRVAYGGLVQVSPVLPRAPMADDDVEGTSRQKKSGDFFSFLSLARRRRRRRRFSALHTRHARAHTRPPPRARTHTPRRWIPRRCFKPKRNYSFEACTLSGWNRIRWR